MRRRLDHLDGVHSVDVAKLVLVIINRPELDPAENENSRAQTFRAPPVRESSVRWFAALFFRQGLVLRAQYQGEPFPR